MVHLRYLRRNKSPILNATRDEIVAHSFLRHHISGRATPYDHVVRTGPPTGAPTRSVATHFDASLLSNLRCTASSFIVRLFAWLFMKLVYLYLNGTSMCFHASSNQPDKDIPQPLRTNFFGLLIMFRNFFLMNKLLIELFNLKIYI